MDEIDKELLFTDLCARVPHGVVAQLQTRKFPTMEVCYMNATIKTCGVNGFGQYYAGTNTASFWNMREVKPFLRSMSDMTAEEEYEYHQCKDYPMETFEMEHTEVLKTAALYFSRAINYLNAHHFDYRGLIPKGLAIKVTKENNPYK